MSSYAPMTCCRLLLTAALLVLPTLAAQAQSRSAASQFNATTISDQINLKVLDAVVQSMSTSFNNPCAKQGGGTVAHGQTWTTTTCPAPLTTGMLTYLCVSGYNTLQSSTCH